MSDRQRDKAGELVAYHFGELDDDEREALERAMVGDQALLREYFALKRHLERVPEDEPRASVRDRLEATLFDETATPITRAGSRRRRWTPWFTPWLSAVGAAAAAVLLWVWLSQPGAPPRGEGRLIDTAQLAPASGQML